VPEGLPGTGNARPQGPRPQQSQPRPKGPQAPGSGKRGRNRRNRRGRGPQGAAAEDNRGNEAPRPVATIVDDDIGNR
jgi:hypothetical protein